MQDGRGNERPESTAGPGRPRTHGPPPGHVSAPRRDSAGLWPNRGPGPVPSERRGGGDALSVDFVRPTQRFRDEGELLEMLGLGMEAELEIKAPTGGVQATGMEATSPTSQVLSQSGDETNLALSQSGDETESCETELEVREGGGNSRLGSNKEEDEEGGRLAMHRESGKQDFGVEVSRTVKKETGRSAIPKESWVEVSGVEKSGMEAIDVEEASAVDTSGMPIGVEEVEESGVEKSGIGVEVASGWSGIEETGWDEEEGRKREGMEKSGVEESRTVRMESGTVKKETPGLFGVEDTGLARRVKEDEGKSQTLNPEPLNSNPMPETRNPKSEIQNPKPQTPNPKPQTPNPKPQTPNPNPKPQTRNGRCERALHTKKRPRTAQVYGL